MILILFLLLPVFIFSAEADYYIIYRGDAPAAYSEITSNGNKFKERVLWFDGYSKEYSETELTIDGKIKYSSEIYYENDKLPIICNLNDGRFEKRMSDRLIKTTIDSDIDFMLKNSNIALFLSGLCRKNGEFKIFDIDKMKSFETFVSDKFVKIKDKEYKIFRGKNTILDSGEIYGLKIIKSKTPISIVNPYTVNLSKIYTEDDFVKKKHHLYYDYGSFFGEVSYDRQSDTVIVILPFSFSSDYNGNLNSIKSYTVRQIAENLKYPVLSLQFNMQRTSRKDLAGRIKDLEKELLRAYSRVIFIGFNDICIDLAESGVSGRKIFINPPLMGIKEWSEMMFVKYSAKSYYLFSSAAKLNEYEAIDTLITEKKIFESYSKSKDSYYIFSKSVLSEKELAKSKKIAGTVFYIKNIDRRLNSYNIYDLWSFEKNILINQKIFSLIGGIIKK